MRDKRAWIVIALVLACTSLALANKEVISFCPFARWRARLSLTHTLSPLSRSYKHIHIRSSCRKEWQQSPARESSVDAYTI